jgi:hypothetical protein
MNRCSTPPPATVLACVKPLDWDGPAIKVLTLAFIQPPEKLLEVREEPRHYARGFVIAVRGPKATTKTSTWVNGCSVVNYVIKQHGKVLLNFLAKLMLISTFC